MRKTPVELLRQPDIFGEGHEQSQAAGGRGFGVMKGTKFEILYVLTYHDGTSWGFTCGVKSLEFFSSPLFYQASGEIEASFFTRRKKGPVIRIFGIRFGLLTTIIFFK
jgi:hypothetical protein